MTWRIFLGEFHVDEMIMYIFIYIDVLSHRYIMGTNMYKYIMNIMIMYIYDDYVYIYLSIQMYLQMIIINIYIYCIWVHFITAEPVESSEVWQSFINQGDHHL